MDPNAPATYTSCTASATYTNYTSPTASTTSTLFAAYASYETSIASGAPTSPADHESVDHDPTDRGPTDHDPAHQDPAHHCPTDPAIPADQVPAVPAAAAAHQPVPPQSTRVRTVTDFIYSYSARSVAELMSYLAPNFHYQLYPWRRVDWDGFRDFAENIFSLFSEIMVIQYGPIVEDAEQGSVFCRACAVGNSPGAKELVTGERVLMFLLSSDGTKIVDLIEFMLDYTAQTSQEYTAAEAWLRLPDKALSVEGSVKAEDEPF